MSPGQAAAPHLSTAGCSSRSHADQEVGHLWSLVQLCQPRPHAQLIVGKRAHRVAAQRMHCFWLSTVPHAPTLMSPPTMQSEAQHQPLQAHAKVSAGHQAVLAAMNATSIIPTSSTQHNACTIELGQAVLRHAVPHSSAGNVRCRSCSPAAANHSRAARDHPLCTSIRASELTPIPTQVHG